jgi:hypothetical protein
MHVGAGHKWHNPLKGRRLSRGAARFVCVALKIDSKKQVTFFPASIDDPLIAAFEADAMPRGGSLRVAARFARVWVLCACRSLAIQPRSHALA